MREKLLVSETPTVNHYETLAWFVKGGHGSVGLHPSPLRPLKQVTCTQQEETPFAGEKKGLHLCPRCSSWVRP